MNDFPYLMTIPEVAEVLRVSRETVRILCVDGELPAIRVRGCWRVRQDILLEWLESFDDEKSA